MTKEEYLAAKARFVAANPMDASYEDAMRMDQHVKEITITNAKAWLIENFGQKDGKFFSALISLHFGSTETDEFCTKHNFYPDYI